MQRCPFGALVVPAVLPMLCAASVFAGAPDAHIISVFGNPANPSGRLRLTGGGFGDEQLGHSVLINDVEAIVTQWTDETIIAYVPEETQTGTALLELVIDSVVADTYELTIEPREQVGRVLWRFAVDADYMNHRPAVGSDGTVYMNDVQGRLYAVSADGGLRWIVDALRGQAGLGAEGRTVVGEDGTIFLVVNPLGPTTDLVAYNPDGTLRWEFIEPDSWGIAVGPAIGPDGHVYVAFYDADQFSYGITSFSPDGQLRWNNNGSPPLYEHGAIGAELAFGASKTGGEIDQVVLTVDRDNDPYLYTFDMADGSQNWAVPRGVIQDPFLQFQIQPNAGPDGTIYMTEFTGLGGLGWGLKAFDPGSGEELWRYDPNIISGASGPDVGSDGVIYFSYDISRIGAVFPDGTEKWTHVDFGGIKTMPRVSPNNDVVMVGGGDFGEPGFFKAIDATSGAELWLEMLTQENGNIVPDASALFTTDGSRAYFPTGILADPEPFQYCYLYALEVLEAAFIVGDLNDDGTVSFDDLLLLLAAWGSCLGDCPEDLDGSSDVGFADLLLLLANWS